LYVCSTAPSHAKIIRSIRVAGNSLFFATHWRGVAFNFDCVRSEALRAKQEKRVVSGRIELSPSHFTGAGSLARRYVSLFPHTQNHSTYRTSSLSIIMVCDSHPRDRSICCCISTALKEAQPKGIVVFRRGYDSRWVCQSPILSLQGRRSREIRH
jgi:hypothetical protein